MDVKAAYNFLRPALEQMTDAERKVLSEMINSGGEFNPAKKKRKKIDPIPTVADYKKMLARTIFKNS